MKVVLLAESPEDAARKAVAKFGDKHVLGKTVYVSEQGYNTKCASFKLRDIKGDSSTEQNA